LHQWSPQSLLPWLLPWLLLEILPVMPMLRAMPQAKLRLSCRLLLFRHHCRTPPGLAGGVQAKVTT